MSNSKLLSTPKKIILYIYNYTHSEYKIILSFISKHFTKKPKVLSVNATIDYILEHNCSVARYGDGELIIMLGWGIRFQEKDQELSKKLRQIIRSQNDKVLVCIPDIFDKLDYYHPETATSWKNHLKSCRTEWYRHIRKDMLYGDALISRFHLGRKDRSKTQAYVDKIKQIWDNKEIVIVEGSGTRMGYGNDLFDNTKKIERIICPAENAFSKYKEILDAILTLDKNKLILIGLGPAATAMAYDLSEYGYQALDLGHIDIEYEWFKSGVEHKCAISNKSVNDVNHNIDGILDKEDFKSQVYKIIS